MSTGFVSHEANSARIILNDKDILEKVGRGFNIIALAGKNHEIIHYQSYDTYGKDDASTQMIEDFNTFPIGSVVIATVFDEGS